MYAVGLLCGLEIREVVRGSRDFGVSVFWMMVGLGAEIRPKDMLRVNFMAEEEILAFIDSVGNFILMELKLMVDLFLERLA